MRDFRDSLSEKTPFVMTRSSVPEFGSNESVLLKAAGLLFNGLLASGGLQTHNHGDLSRETLYSMSPKAIADQATLAYVLCIFLFFVAFSQFSAVVWLFFLSFLQRA